MLLKEGINVCKKRAAAVCRRRVLQNQVTIDLKRTEHEVSL